MKNLCTIKDADSRGRNGNFNVTLQNSTNVIQFNEANAMDLKQFYIIRSPIQLGMIRNS